MKLKHGERLWVLFGTDSLKHGKCEGCYGTTGEKILKHTIKLYDDSGYHHIALCRKCLMAAADLILIQEIKNE